MRHTAMVLGALAGFGLACGPGPGEATVEVDECADGADVDETTLITWELEESVHEMITCGSLTFQLIGALAETAQTMMTEPAGLPGAFSFDDGQYRTQGVGVTMDLELRYGPDSPGGDSGEVIPHNVFDPDSYLAGASATEDGDVVTVSFAEPGPLVRLLGQGASPESPLVLDEEDLAAFSANLLSLKLKASIDVEHEVVTSTITYNIDNPARFVADALLQLQMEMSLVQSATGTRPDLGQDLHTTTWDITYNDATGNLDGQIVAEVVGGPFDFQIDYDYDPLLREPSVAITCLD